jgi:hypothetical protein
MGMTKHGHRVHRIAAVMIVFGMSGGTAFAQLAPSIPSMPSPAPSLPQPLPSYNTTIPNISEPPQAVAAPPAVEAAPYGVHQTTDGKWSLNPGCHWVDPDDENDIRATCD